MMAFDPRSGGVRDFDLCQGDVFEAVGRPFLVTCPDDSGRGSLLIVDEYGRVRSVDEARLSGALVVLFLRWRVILARGGLSRDRGFSRV